MPARQVYVISDLHLGGVYGATGNPLDRGFRLCTHAAGVAEFIRALVVKAPGAPAIELVINGDMVDFLAEREPGNPPWVPFTADENAAAAKLDAILSRDPEIVAALRAFLDRGHRLVLLIGNHDIELALPAVRRRLLQILGVRGHHDFTFIYDGEAYYVGDSLIEHGNRYDKFNVVDYDALRRVRSLLSRRQAVPPEYAFVPPPGSRMVSHVINPIKEQYRFVDLLKPETEAVIPLLLALEPGFRTLLAKAVVVQTDARHHRLAEAALPMAGGDISSGSGAGAAMGGGLAAGGFDDMRGGTPLTPPPQPPHDELERILQKSLGKLATDFHDALNVGEAAVGSDISAMDTIDRSLGLLALLTARKTDGVEKRLRALLMAVRAVRDNQAFARDVETDAPTWESACELANRGARYVVFGHTHLPKRVPLLPGGAYLNAGTWADVFAFPKEIVELPEADALTHLHDFVARIGKGDFSEWTLFHPTYVRLDIDDAGVTGNAELCDYTAGAAV